MKFNSKEIHKYLEKHQQELSSLRLYFTKYEEISTNSAKTVIEMNEEIKKNLNSITQNKTTLKTIKQFAQNIEEKQSSENIAEFLKTKLNNWIRTCQQILANIKEQMRNLDGKLQKKQLSEKEIAEFKTYLLDSLVSFQQNKQAIISHFCTLQISCNSLLLESLTNRIQRVGNV